MTRGSIVLLGWGMVLAAMATLAAVWTQNATTSLLLAGSAVAATLVAGLSRARAAERRERLLTDTSAAPMLLAAGITLALNGLAFGLWLILIGAEVLALGLGLLVRELREAPPRAGSPEAGERER